MEHYDVAIIGGGPVGLRLSSRLAARGFSVVVVEEHKKIGEPVQCSGLVTPRVMEFLPPTERDDVIRSAKYGAIVIGPHSSINFRANEIKAYVIDRGEYDRKMADMAVNSGASLITGTRVTDIYRDGKEWRFKAGKSDIRASILVGADGAGSIVARKCGINRGNIEIIATWQVRVARENEEIDKVDIFVGSKYAPGFFGWHIPVDEKTSLVGVGAKPELLNGHIARYGERILKRYGGRIISIEGGPIPIGLVKESTGDGCLLVGDAAAQVKPTSGGGLYAGLRCADIAAETIIMALENDDTSIVRQYHQKWMATVGKEIKTGMRLRRMFISLTDDEIDEILERLNTSDVIQTIIQRGDIDYPWRLAFTLAKKAPWILKYFPRLMG